MMNVKSEEAQAVLSVLVARLRKKKVAARGGDLLAASMSRVREDAGLRRLSVTVERNKA